MSNQQQPGWFFPLIPNISQIQNSGGGLPQRQAINFTGVGVTATDDPVNGRTNVAIVGGGIPPAQGTTIALVGGLNSNISIPGTQSSWHFSQSANTIIGGFSPATAPVAGQFYDATFATNGTTVKIRNADPSSAASARILTPTGADFYLPIGQNVRARFLFNGTDFELKDSGAPSILLINVLDWGLVGDGSTLNDTAMTALIAYIKTAVALGSDYEGIEVYWPFGTYLFSTPWNFDTTAAAIGSDFPSILWRGAGGGINANYRSASTILFTGTGGTPALTTVSASGTSPPAVTLSGTPTADSDVLIEITATGTGTAAVFKWSVNAGQTFTTGVSVASTVALANGITAHFPVSGSDSYTNDNIYQSRTYYTFWSARTVAGWQFEKLSILYNDSSFFGTTIDMSASPTVGATSVGCTMRDCSVGSDGDTTMSAKNLVLYDSAEDMVFENSTFQGAIFGLRGTLATCYDSGQENNIGIRDNLFISLTTAAIVNPGFQAVEISGNTFEGGIMPYAVYSDNFQTALCFGLKFSSNWLGDTGAGLENDAWITPGYLQFRGADFSGNNFDNLPANGSNQCRDSIRLGSCEGVTIHGNLIGTIDFSPGTSPPGSDPQGVVIKGNRLLGSNTQYAPYFRTLEVFSGSSVEYLQSVFDVDIGQNYNSTGLPLGMLVIGGHLCTRPVYGLQPTILSSGTNVTASIADSNEFEGSNDTAGRIELIVGTGGFTPGVLCTVKFGMGYDYVNGLPPKMILQPETTGLPAALLWTTPTWSQFIITADGALAAGTYYLSYMVMQ